MGEEGNSKLLREIRDGGGGFFDRLLVKTLLSLIRILFRYKKSQYNRVVSFGDLFIDRTEKAKFLGFGEWTTIYDSSLVIGDVKVGKNTWIGPFTVLDGSSGLEIGDNCSIASGVQIYSHETIFWALSGRKMKYGRSKTVIGNCCYIGPHTVVNMGVKIGSHCLIGANSVVNTDLDDYSIAAGCPCKLIGHVKVGDDGNVELIMNHNTAANK
jgi:acetyltransferase-like isoleucine patch superfamily enzyme